MRPPTSITDRGPLEDEPLLSYCSIRMFQCAREPRNPGHRSKFNESWFEMMDEQNVRAVCTAAQKWVDLVVHQEGSRRNASSGLQVHDDLMHIFFNFYYKLYQHQNNDEVALEYLKERKEIILGYYKLIQARPKDTNANVLPKATVQNSRGRVLAPVAVTRRGRKKKQRRINRDDALVSQETSNDVMNEINTAQSSSISAVVLNTEQPGTQHSQQRLTAEALDSSPQEILTKLPQGSSNSVHATKQDKRNVRSKKSPVISSMQSQGDDNPRMIVETLNRNPQETSIHLPQGFSHPAHISKGKERKRKAKSQQPPAMSSIHSSIEETSSASPSTQTASASAAPGHRPKRLASNPERLTEVVEREQLYELNPNQDLALRLSPTHASWRQVATRGRKQPTRGRKTSNFARSIPRGNPTASSVANLHEPPDTSLQAPVSVTISLAPLDQPEYTKRVQVNDQEAKKSKKKGRHVKANSELPSRDMKRARRHPKGCEDDSHEALSATPIQTKSSSSVERGPLLSRPVVSSESPGSGLEAQSLQGKNQSDPAQIQFPPLAQGPTLNLPHFLGKRSRSEFEQPSSPGCTTHYLTGFRSIRGPPRRGTQGRTTRNTLKLVVDATTANVHQMTAEDVDRCLRDIATGAIAQSQESTPSIPDWTLEEEIDPTFEATDDSNNIPSNSNQEEPITPTNVKPCLSHNPPLWATSRQEICESTDYFRSYQGGVYFSKEVVKGYLLSAFSASHDIFHHGGKLIISHGGGKAESTLGSRCGEKRHMSADDQQATDHSVHALLNTYESKRPLILLADDKYSLFPFDLAASGFTYVVLGLYWISHAWAERQSADNSRGHVVRYKFAFQWCEEQGFPWWIPPDRLADIAIAPSLPPEPNNNRVPEGLNREESLPLTLTSQELPPTTNQTCAQCARKSSVVYSCGWMCLRPRCSAFWSLATGERPPSQLEYDEEFLRLLPANFKDLPALRPITPHSPDEITTSYLFTKGWHCPKCGRLSSRYKWEQWECSSCGCHLEVKGRVRQPNEFWHQRPNATFLHSHIGKNSGIIQCLPKPFNYGKGFTNCLTFILPRQRGSIHLILGSPMANETANVIFKKYQEEATSGQLKLRRYPLRTHKLRGPLLTNYFSQNTGEPYQYIGGTGNTVPFKKAPKCVNQAIKLIKERAQLALGRDIGFNEILSAAYMERQKMSFHSDSEKGLGPTVASLSLGSTAFMHFRAYDTATKGQPLHDLTLILRHGDVLIMEGEGVQKHYEHTVIPMNFRIAATARCIGSV